MKLSFDTTPTGGATTPWRLAVWWLPGVADPQFLLCVPLMPQLIPELLLLWGQANEPPRS